MRRKISKHFSGNTERLVNRIFFVVIPVLLGLTLVFSVYSSSRANQLADELRRQNETLVAIADAQKNSLETTRHDVADLKETLICIGMFFSSPDRAKLIITSYAPCIVENTDTGESREISLQTGSGSNKPSAPGGSQQSDLSSNTVPSSSSQNTPPQKPMQSDNSQKPPVVNPPEPPRSLLEQLINGTMDIVRRVI